MKPIYVAIIRAVGGGFVLGMSMFWATFSQTDDMKLLVTAFNVPFWGTIATRGAAEGWWDTVRK